jgi:hypothetical protein
LPFDEVRGDIFAKDSPEFTNPVKPNLTKTQVGGVDVLLKNPNDKTKKF